MVTEVVWLLLAAAAGFLMGRASAYGGREAEETANHTEERAVPEEPEHDRRSRGNRQATGMEEWSVGSPVSGEVAEHREGERPTVVIHPDGNKVYAPSGGKITRLFPMGNAMLFTTEFGAELFIQAGKSDDELLNRYYRPKIIQNEVVGKGKLLLEFDRQGLEAEGVPAEVSVSVEACAYGGDVKMTAGERVKTGEEILRVLEPKAQEFR